MKKQKILPLILLPMLVFCFLSASLFTAAQVDTSVLTMSGKGWQIKIDQQLQTETVTSSPYATVTKQGQEKELFLQINSIQECASGTIEFKIDVSGLTFYKQLPLDKELSLSEQYDFINTTHAILKDQVIVHRPENVVNSFAGFDSDGKKQLHIYASKIIDAKGQEIWLDSDLTQGLLTVYLPEQKTLESLSFPLLLDPTFGYTDIGGTVEALAGDTVAGYKCNLTEAGSIAGIYFYTGTGELPGEFKCAIYDDNSGTPLNLQGVTNAKTMPPSESNGWKYATFSTPIDLLTGTYWLMSLGNTSLYYAYDAIGTNTFIYKSLTYPNYEEEWTLGSKLGRSMSIYANYTVTGEPTPTPTPTATPPPVSQETDSTLNLVILLACLGLAILLMAWNRLPLLNFVFGIFIIGIAAYSLTINLYAGGLLQLAVIIIGVICMYSGYREAV